MSINRILALFVLSLPLLVAADDTHWPAVSSDDMQYLHDLARDTWDCIAYYVEPHTGLPYDTSKMEKHSSVTNLGYYAASCAVASEMGFVSAEEATLRVRKVLDSYEKFEKWNGFSQSWNNVSTLEPAPHDTMISVLDSGNMAAGFALAAQVLPGVREQANRILAEMNWKAFYDAKAGLLWGGYDLKRKHMDKGWHVGDYAGDGRMAAFWAIAVGAAPVESWKNLKRETEEHYGFKYYQPGWMGGGLFMQTQDGLFLDERFTPAGESTANFAYAQMLYANTLNLPAWGWSACNSPDNRYLGWGSLEVDVVTPHAAGMATMIYPGKSTACLRQLEKMGARKPIVENGKSYEFGFRDSIHLKTRAISDRYLVSLDQTMLFLGIANTIENRLVQRLFQDHSTVRNGLKSIPEFSAPVDEKWVTELKRRDREPLELPAETVDSGPSLIPISDFSKVSTWTRDSSDDTVSIKAVYGLSDKTGKSKQRSLRIAYDVESPNPAFGGVNIPLNSLNCSGCNTLRLKTRGTPSTLKIEAHCSGGIGVTRLRGISPDDWTESVIPFTALGGMITDWSSVDRIVLVFEDNVSVPKTGMLLVRDIEFFRNR